MKLFLCSHFSSVGSLIKEEIENKKVAFLSETTFCACMTPRSFNGSGYMKNRSTLFLI